jgi:hypothetical protein
MAREQELVAPASFWALAGRVQAQEDRVLARLRQRAQPRVAQHLVQGRSGTAQLAQRQHG